MGEISYGLCPPDSPLPNEVLLFYSNDITSALKGVPGMREQVKGKARQDLETARSNKEEDTYKKSQQRKYLPRGDPGSGPGRGTREGG